MMAEISLCIDMEWTGAEAHDAAPVINASTEGEPGNAEAAREGIFGPGSPGFRFSGFDRAMLRAGQANIGLSSYIFIDDPWRTQAATHRIDTDTVSASHCGTRFAEGTIGGIKDTGSDCVGDSEGPNTDLLPKLISIRFD